MRVFLSKSGQAMYHVWFYILAAIPIFIFFPLLLLTSLSKKTYSFFFWLARNLWAAPILYGMGCPPKIQYEQKMECGKSYMLVANHTSILDIMLMLRISKNPFVFVGKKELATIPIFGFFYKRVCILVDRNDPGSRTSVYRRAQKRLHTLLSICIFPEGGVPDEAVILDEFKDGAFKMAIAHKIPIVPITLLDTKKRFPFRFLGGIPGSLHVKVHIFVGTLHLGIEQTVALKKRVREIILKELVKHLNC